MSEVQVEYGIKQPATKKRLWKIKFTLIVVAILFIFVAVAQFASKKATAYFFTNLLPEPTHPVTAIQIVSTDWTPVISTTGIVKANQGGMLSSQAMGTVTRILFTPGERVKKGEVLIELDNQVEQANLNAQLAQLNSVKANYERFLTLFRSKNVSQLEFEGAEASYKSLVANIEAAKANIARRQVTAPFDGIVGIAQVSVGDFVNMGTPMVRVEDLSEIKIDFAVGQNQLTNLFLGQTIQVVVDAIPDQQFTAKISAIEPAISEKSGLVNVQATLTDGKNVLRPGMFARLGIELPKQADQIVLPLVSIAYNMYGENVYRLAPLSEEDREKLAKRPDIDQLYRAYLVTVNTIDSHGIYAQLKASDLKVGDWIVTGGQQRLSNGSLVIKKEANGVGTTEPAEPSRL